MRELVKRGTAALPALLDHLSDARPTDLVVGGGDFHYMFMEYGDEYDSRHHHAPDFADELSNDALQGFRADTSHPTEKYFHEPYVLKVGDVCYALIGQIVDRQLVAARYQPTAGLVVNSPIVMPGLADRVRKDWSGLDAQAHRDGLIEDAKTVYGYEAVAAALVRLRFYYPQDYALQKSGDLGKAIAKFEQDEKSRKR